MLTVDYDVVVDVDVDVIDDDVDNVDDVSHWSSHFLHGAQYFTAIARLARALV